MATEPWEMRCPDGATIEITGEDGNPGCLLLRIVAWDDETDSMLDGVYVTINLDGAVMFAAAMLARLIEINPMDSTAV